MFSQAARVIKGESNTSVLGELEPKRLLTVAQSQSAIFMTTYINAVDPQVKSYDGHLVLARFGSAASIDGASIFLPAQNKDIVHLRGDSRVPTIVVVSETDVVGSVANDEKTPSLLGYFHARQPDNDQLRVWEVAGASHLDGYVAQVAYVDSGATPIESLAAAYLPTSTAMGSVFKNPINNGIIQHYVMKAALSKLDGWVRTGKPPPSALPLTFKNRPSDITNIQLATDARGNAKGGVRTPWVDVPVAKLTGTGNSGAPAATLAGTTTLFTNEKISALYPDGRDGYMNKFLKSLEEAITAGFLLQADKAEIQSLAKELYPTNK